MVLVARGRYRQFDSNRVSAFTATNIDDIFLLMIFISSLTYPIRHIILGQYLGIGSLIGISIVGSLITLVVPTYVVGLMGIAPIAIGLKHLIEKKEKGQHFKACSRRQKEQAIPFFSVSRGRDVFKWWR